jgi:secreted trypsin-like serine protease
LPRLAGVASYGARRCGAPRQSAVYTKAAAYAGWIRQTVARFTPAEPQVARPPISEPADLAPVSAGLGSLPGPA